MEKQVRRFQVGFDFNWDYGVEIKKMKEDLNALENLGATEIDIELGDGYESSFVQIKAFINRLETDEEHSERINKEDRQRRDSKRRELAELERLKNKYECDSKEQS